MKLFSKQVINTGRQRELDFLKGLSVIFMIMIHSQMNFLKSDYLGEFWAVGTDFLGTVPAASIFMFIMGIGFSYSSETKPPSYFIKRGLKILLISYILNIVRNVIPLILLSVFNRNTSLLYDAVRYFGAVDILQFAGLAMVTFGLFGKLKAPKWCLLPFMFLCAAANIFLVQIKTENDICSSITGLLWGSSEMSFFPYLTWILYPMVGVLFGELLKRCINKKTLYLICILGGGFIWSFNFYILYLKLGMNIGLGGSEIYYHHTILGNITILSFDFMWIGIWFFAINLLPQIVILYFERLARNMTAIYCVQWVIISWIAILISSNFMGLILYFPIMIAVIMISDYWAWIYYQFLKKRTVIPVKHKIINIIMIILILIAASYVSYQYSEIGSALMNQL